MSASIVLQMADALEEVVQAPECPNLYWALAALPRPFLDLSAASEGERFLLEREFPRLRGMEGTIWSINEARAFGDELESKGGLFLERWANPSSSLTQPSIGDLAGHLAVAGLVARAYPEAKRALKASGTPEDRVEAMPATQVVAIDSYRTYQSKRDNVFKWVNLPYSQAHRGLREAEKQVFEGASAGIPFVAMLPGIQGVFNVPERTDRRFAILRVVEGVRMYAASHGGSPPPSLDALAESPAPLDPATGTTFAYSVAGSTASVDAPPPPGLERVPQYGLHYRIHIARWGCPTPAQPSCQETMMLRKCVLLGVFLINGPIDAHADDPRAEAVSSFLDADVAVVGSTSRSSMWIRSRAS